MKKIPGKKYAVGCLILISAICFAGTGLAGDGKKGTKDGRVKTGMFIPGEGGRIDRIDLNTMEVVINDCQFGLSARVKYFKMDGNRAKTSDFTTGQRVRYRLGPDRKIRQLFLDNGEMDLK